MRDIRITPKLGSTASNDYPKIEFGGLSASTIKLQVDDDGSVVYTGTYGVLFNVTDDKYGLLHSVNDVSGLPILQVYSWDYVQLGKWDKYALSVATDKVGVGLTAPSTKLHIYSTQSGAFRLQDGTQASGYVLTSDSNGVGSWAAVSSGPTVNSIANGSYNSPAYSSITASTWVQVASAQLPTNSNNNEYIVSFTVDFSHDSESAVIAGAILLETGNDVVWDQSATRTVVYKANTGTGTYGRGSVSRTMVISTNNATCNGASTIDLYACSTFTGTNISNYSLVIQPAPSGCYSNPSAVGTNTITGGAPTWTAADFLYNVSA